MRCHYGENAVKDTVSDRISTRLRRAAMAIVASGVVAAAPAHANPSHNIVVVPPTELPAAARQSGEAMFLHETVARKTLLYVEQNQGTRLAIFDVTDPLHITGKGSVPLDASGPFDFVSPRGNHSELVRFRRDQQVAVLDLPSVKAPSLKTLQGLTLQGPITTLGNDGLIATQTSESPPARDHQPIDSANSQELNRLYVVKQVRDEVTKADTGTTFILTENGLYVIRRPAIESIHRVMMSLPNG
jgi:hypothetical protein